MRISRILVTLFAVGSIALSTASVSMGQGPGGRGGRGGPGGGMMGGGFGLSGLLRMDEVRKELKLDEDQVKELETLATSMRDEMAKQFPGFGPGGQGGRGPGGGGAGPGGAGPGGAGPGGAGGGAPPDFEKMREAMASMQSKTEEKIGEILDPTQLDRLLGLSIQRDGVQALSSKLVAERLKITEEQKAKMAELEKALREEMMSMFSGGPPGPEVREKMQTLRTSNEEKVKALLTEAQKNEMESLKGEKFEFPAPQFGPGGPGGPGGGNRGNRGNRGGAGA